MSKSNTEINSTSEPVTKPMLPDVRVQWSLSADIECPHCEHIHDFMAIDEWYLFSQVAENKTDFMYKIDYECEQCGGEFKVNGSDY